MSYNLSGIKSGLKLDGPTIAKIFSGQIKTWNDAAIKALNPGMSLPSTSITVVHRSDSSGTTDGFTKFLVRHQTRPGSPPWARARTSSGRPAPAPRATPASPPRSSRPTGAIGYVEQAYALENGFTYAAVKDSTGQYVLPTIANTSSAANGITVPADLGISTINSPASGAYPIVSQTFLEAYKDPCKDGGASASTAKALKSFLTYAFGDGQKTLGAGGNQLPYAPLPSALQAKDTAQLATMTCNGSPIS